MGPSNGLRARFASEDDLTIEVAPGTSVEGLFKKLPSLGPSVAYDDMMIHVFVNGKLTGFDSVLEPGDVIDIHIPVSGG
jgi:molybdopterin converting factor small subunit